MNVKLSDMTSAQLGVAYMSYKLSDTKFSGLILTPEFRIYPKKNAIDGFYIAPYLRYQNFTVKNTSDDCKGITDCQWVADFFLDDSGLPNQVLQWICFLEDIMEVASVKVDSGDTDSFDTEFIQWF